MSFDFGVLPQTIRTAFKKAAEDAGYDPRIIERAPADFYDLSGPTQPGPPFKAQFRSRYNPETREMEPEYVTIIPEGTVFEVPPLGRVIAYNEVYPDGESRRDYYVCLNRGSRREVWQQK